MTQEKRIQPARNVCDMGAAGGSHTSRTAGDRPSPATRPSPLASRTKILLLAVLLAFPFFAAQAAPQDTQDTGKLNVRIKERLKAIDADVHAIKVVHKAVATELPKEESAARALTLSLKLPGFFTWSDRFYNAVRGNMDFTLYSCKGKAVALPAPYPGAGNLPCYIDASDLEVSPTALNGSLRVRIGDVWSREVTVAIEATISGEDVTGTYIQNSPDTRCEGRLTGKVSSVTPRPISVAKIDDEFDTPIADRQYSTAKSLEGESISIYNDVRAMLLARDGRLSYAHATILAASDSFSYPKLPTVTVTGKVEKEDEVPGLDDTMLRSSLNIGVSENNTAPPAGSSPIILSALFKELDCIARRVSARRRILESVRDGDSAGPAPVVGVQEVGDPEFGPWYGSSLLPSDNQAVNRIPSDAGSVGQQTWMQVGNWMAFGPCPLKEAGFETPAMPDVVPGEGMTMPWDPRFKDTHLPAEGLSVSVQLASMEPGSGFCRLGLCESYEDHGPRRISFPFATTYAWTEVNCSVDMELWVGVTANDRGQFWVNDRLAWTTTPNRPVRHMEETGVFRCRFRKGFNRLYLRQDNLEDDGYFSVRVCVRGAPRPVAEVTATEAAQDMAGPPTDGVWGWRQDYSGHHGENVAAPIAWDPHEKINVKWIKPMKFCYASPLVIGDKVITLEEPHTVVCVNKMTGAELWRTDCDIIVLADAATQAEARPIREQAEAARRELAGLGEDASADDTRVRELKKTVASYAEYLQRKGIFRGIGWYNDVGHTYPTPVTDGEHVFVKINTGALACIDLEGKIKWLVDHGVKTTSSPSRKFCFCFRQCMFIMLRLCAPVQYAAEGNS